MKRVVRSGNSASGVNMRAKANKAGDVVAVIKDGTEVDVTEAGKTWSKIQYKGKIGYMMTEYLQEIDVYDEMENVSGTIKVDRAELQKIYNQIGYMLKGIKPVKN